MTAIKPGSTIGILGGGQLGRMTAMAAAQLGYKTHIYCPEPEAPASDVASAFTQASYEDKKALESFAKSVDVVTLEFENVPADAIEFLSKKIPTRPGAKVLEITQDRIAEKDFCNSLKIPTAPYMAIDAEADLKIAAEKIGLPAILKTRRFGYDGKGQVRLNKKTDLAAAWAEIGNQSAIWEGLVDFRLEISVIAARSPSGEIVCYPAVENRHKNQILDETIVPAPIYPHQAKKAAAIARKIAQQMKLQGMIAIEMFVVNKDRILVNEMAPRPHNSGHWTIDAAVTSQFEQLVRAVCDLPLGSPAALGPARMKNLLGEDCRKYMDILSDPTAKLHLYGKGDIKPGRKMGHVTRLLKK